jgi:subtilisin family serine protease
MGNRRRPSRVGLVAAVVLGGAVLMSGAAASGASPQLRLSSASISPLNTISVAKTESGRLARTSPGLLGQTSSNLINVLIKYDLDPTASYMGGVDGLKATSPSVTHESLASDRQAVSAYNQYANLRISSLNAEVRAAVPAATIGYRYTTVYGGVSARVPANSIAALLKIPGVAAVQKDTLQHPLDDNTKFLGATAVWPKLGGSTTAGSNVVVGVIDTGVWPEHPMLSPAGIAAPAGGLKGCQFGDGSDTANLGPTFACNNKLIGAYAFTNTYLANIPSDGQEFCDDTTKVCSPRDPEGHGTHTTTTAAGDCVSSAVIYGVQRGPVCGIAPGAHVEMFRVCLAQGCFSSDSVAAIAQAVHDGVNVINFSISGGADPYTDPVELAFLDATNARISVNAAAGNGGPDSGTADHGGPWVTTVGASTGPRSFSSTLHLTADGGATLSVPGVTLTNGISSPTPVVLAASLGGGEDAQCQSDAPAGSATGEIVVCERGSNGRVDKGRRMLAGGAAGMILYNQAADVTDLESDNHYLPAIQTQYFSNAVANFVAGHTNVMATWAQGVAKPSTPDVMASFSSRGPNGDWVKPDVTAPGVQVLAGTTPEPDQTTADNGPPGNLYMAIAGTSMATPHAAGISALVRAAHPAWTPEEIKSALMTSALTKVVEQDGKTRATPFDMGAGRIRAKAVNPTLVFNETYADFVAAGTDTIHRVDLNIPSIDETTFSGDIVTHRTAINVSGKKQTFKVHLVHPAGVTITVGNHNQNLVVGQGASLTFPIEISAPDVADGQYFARINLVPVSGATRVTIPVAFVKQQGSVSLSNTCSPLSIVETTGLSHCTVTAQNLGSVAANTVINVVNRSGTALGYRNVAAPGTVIGTGTGVHWSGSLAPTHAPPVASIASGGEPFGYVALSSFGVPPIPGTGDETISDFQVPDFYYGGEVYSSLGMVSNGYVVVGGGDSGDVNFVPQTFPNPARPNNVVAPFWTDLNPSFGGNLYISTLSNGTDVWIVCDWEAVRNYDTADTHTFEVWIRVPGGTGGNGAGSEQISMAYGPNGAQDPDNPAGDSNWGAENRDGSSGISLASYPGNGVTDLVTLGPPIPGGAVTLGFDIWSGTPGSWFSDARLTSDQTPGTTIASRKITVHS